METSSVGIIGGVIAFALGVPLLLFWVWMFVAAVKNDYKFRRFRIIVILFTNVFGSAVFYFVVYKKRLRSLKK